ncbi:MAG TPA: right-handed parallel beta-helix repeat-containing protein [Mucilaginibacter sp.]|nr:right-handed parallel beta-helix repeat-containing protein [Mucilaginibacter sp.]
MKTKNLIPQTGIVTLFTFLIILTLLFVSCKKDSTTAPDTDTTNTTTTGTTTTGAAGTPVTGGTTTGGTVTTTPTTGGTTTTTPTTGGTTTPTTGGTTTTPTTGGTHTGTTTGGTTTTTPTTGGTTTTPTTGGTHTGTTTGGTTTPTTGGTTTTPTTGGTHTTTPTTGGTPTTTPTTPTTGGATTITYKASSPIVLSGTHDKVIRGIATASISLYNCYNITIVNCKIGPNKLTGIQTSNCTNIKIDSCYISNVSTGVYAVDSKSISVTNCQAKNMQGPYPKGAFVQFDNVSGADCRVSFNKFENILGQSYPEDAISMYKSNGLASDPIMIEGNWIRGGGPSVTGGGIMLGDNGGSNITAKNNILVDPGQYGMAVSGGTNMSVINNSIYAKAQSFTNVGLYYWNQSGLPSSNITISGNKVNFTSQKWGLNNTYLGAGNATPIGWGTNILNAKISAAILPSSIITQLN